jgi:hypothetical protein
MGCLQLSVNFKLANEIELRGLVQIGERIHVQFAAQTISRTIQIRAYLKFKLCTV